MKRAFFSIAVVVCVLGSLVALGQFSGPMRIDEPVNRMPIYQVIASDAPGWMRETGPNTRLCDGTRDEEQIQPLLDAVASAGGGYVQLSVGTFVIADTLKFPDTSQSATHWGLVGQGKDATILQSAAGKWSPVLVPALETCARKPCILRDLTFDGNRANVGISKTFTPDADINTTADTITITTHGFTSGDEVFVSTSGTLCTDLNENYPFYVNSVDANTVKLYTTRAGAEAGGATALVDLTDDSSSDSHNLGRAEFDCVIKINRTMLDLQNVTIKNGYRDGCYIACFKSTLNNCEFLFNTRHGVFATGVGGLTFANCTVWGNRDDGIRIDGNSEPVLMDKCVVAYNGTQTDDNYGISIQGSTPSTRTRITNCSIYGNGHSGLLAANNCDDLLVAFCDFRANRLLDESGGNDIWLAGADRVRLIGNYVNAAPMTADDDDSVLEDEDIGEGIDVKSDLLDTAVQFTEGSNDVGVRITLDPSTNVAGWTIFSLDVTYLSPTVEAASGQNYLTGGEITETVTWESDDSEKYLTYPATRITDIVVSAKTVGGGTNTATIDVGNDSALPNTPVNVSAATVGLVAVGNTFTGHTFSPGVYLLSNVTGSRCVLGNRSSGPSHEAKTLYMKNTRGDTIARGDVVILCTDSTNTDGDEIDITTTAGDSRVIGMADEQILDDAWGYVLVVGKTVHLKADGTDDIAVGDKLSAFTTAGVAQKAASGETVFAIALEAYATNDSNGVIDALLITPRQAE